MLQADIIRTYLSKFPYLPSLTLAKLIYKENPSVWKDVEYARRDIRYQRGAMGKNRIYGDKTFHGPHGKYNPFSALPEGMTAYADWSPIEITGKKVLVLADTHIPYHDHAALSIALKFGKDNNADTILIMGDFIDFYSCSFWDNDPRRRNFKQEIETAEYILEHIRGMFPKAKIILKIGNHEERYERYMRVKAPELLGYEAFELTSLIHADEYNVDVVGDKKIIKIGRLHCVHGHEFWKGVTNPVNPARGLYLRGKEIALCAHYHQTSQHTEKSLADAITSCWSIGCLCDLHPDYSPVNKWNHGFAWVENAAEFTCENKKIIGGRIYSA